MALLTSIPGIGVMTAAGILVEMPDITLFRTAKQVAAYAGLSPRNRQSGSSILGPGRLAGHVAARERCDHTHVINAEALRPVPAEQLAVPDRCPTIGRSRRQQLGQERVPTDPGQGSKPRRRRRPPQ
jgi:Transposase IS116/IS110/IS902 family